jgi:flagellar hook-length control protein FliK
MRVVQTPQPSQSAGEMPAKSIESENAPAGAFFAEIDRALNMEGREEIPNEEKAPGQNSETSDNNDLSLFLGACLFAMQPVKTESNVLMDPSGLDQVDGEANNPLDAAVSGNEETAKPSPSGSMKSQEKILAFESKMNSFASALFLFQPAADFATQNPGVPSTGGLSEAGLAEQSAGENGASLVERALNGLQPFADASVLKQQDAIKNEPAFVLPLAQIGKNENIKQSGSISNTASVPQIGSVAAESISIDVAGKSETKSKADFQYSSEKMIVSGQEILQKIAGADNDGIKQDTINRSPVIQELRQEFPSAIEKTPVGHSMSASNTAFPQDSNGSGNESIRADILRKIDNAGQEGSGELDARVATVVRAASETTGMSGSRSDGENENSAKTKISMGEHSQDKSVGMAVGFERSANTSLSATSPNAAAPARPGELVYQIADRIQVQLRDGKNEIRIQLKPESLGSLEIRAEATGNGVVARITAESAAVKNYLENNLHVLQQSLQDQGLKIERIQVAVQDVVDRQSSSGQSAQFGHAASGGRQWSDTHNPAQPGGDLFSNPAEEIAVDPITLITPGSANRFHTVA